MIEIELSTTKLFVLITLFFSLFNLTLYQYIVLSNKQYTIYRYELDRGKSSKIKRVVG